MAKPKKTKNAPVNHYCSECWNRLVPILKLSTDAALNSNVMQFMPKELQEADAVCMGRYCDNSVLFAGRGFNGSLADEKQVYSIGTSSESYHAVDDKGDKVEGDLYLYSYSIICTSLGLEVFKHILMKDSAFSGRSKAASRYFSASYVHSSVIKRRATSRKKGAPREPFTFLRRGSFGRGFVSHVRKIIYGKAISSFTMPPKEIAYL